MLVHVMAPKDGEGLEPDERVCPDGNDDPLDWLDAEVVYHALAVQLADGSWACPSCGENSGPQREQARTVQ